MAAVEGREEAGRNALLDPRPLDPASRWFGFVGSVVIGVSLSGEVLLSQFRRTFEAGLPLEVHVDFGNEPPPTPPPVARMCVRPPDRWPYSLWSIGFSSATASAGTSSPTTRNADAKSQRRGCFT
jgi:hypothetical protein